MLQKLCILLLGYLGYRLWKRVMDIDERVTCNEDKIETCENKITTCIQNMNYKTHKELEKERAST